MKHFLFLFILTSLVSCDKITSLVSNNTFIEPETPEAIYNKYKSGVVLITNQYYYEIDIAGAIYYYSPDSTEKIFSSKAEVLQNLSSLAGTGFIISDYGEIITNNHVVNPQNENYLAEFSELIETTIENFVAQIDFVEAQIELLNAEYNYLPASSKTAAVYDTYLNNYNSLRSNLDTIRDEYQEFLNTNPTSKLIIYKIGIAYNNNDTTDFEDLQECAVIKLSDNKNVDLALIQTKNKKFATPPDHIFNFKDNNPNVFDDPEKFPERDISQPVNINDDVYMIGYNHGFTLAKTQLGLKVQFTSGKISQECDGVRILYTIPTLPGSSGSPVVDKWGNLIGVNFAGLTGTQNFNFAVPVAVLKKFYEQ